MVGDEVGSFDFAEIRLDLFEHFHAARVTLIASRGLGIFRLRFWVLQDEWVVIDTEEACPAGVAAAAADANEARQFEPGRAELLSNMRAKRRELHSAHRQITVMQQESRPWVAAFLAGHRANDRDVVHCGGALWQAVGDLNS